MVECSEPLGRADAQAKRSPGRTVYAQLRVRMPAIVTEAGTAPLLDHQPIPPPRTEVPCRGRRQNVPVTASEKMFAAAFVEMSGYEIHDRS